MRIAPFIFAFVTAASALTIAQDARPRLRPLNEQSTNSKTGPAIGAHIPAFEAVDLDGKVRNFANLKGPKGLLLSFSRSADWCPYCKTQLADLNTQVEGFRKKGINVVALTYDSADILKTFAARVGVQYTLLSDPESKVIKAFDILNPNGEKGTRYEGIPFPGTYVINEKGVITAKYFDDDYRERFSAASILTREFTSTGVLKNTVENAQVKLTYSASESTVTPGRRITLIVDVEPKAKMHLYAPGVERYDPIQWNMPESKAWISFPAVYPKSQMLNLPAIKETVPVYSKGFRVTRDIAIGLDAETAPVMTADRMVKVQGSFRYQACDDRECYLPKNVPLEWNLLVGQLDTQRVPEAMQRKTAK
ncbi:MAG: peroxiredoxin family protein [Bryobacteraceae bacterium]